MMDFPITSAHNAKQAGVLREINGRPHCFPVAKSSLSELAKTREAP